MVVNITTIVYLRVFIIEIGSTIILMVVEAQGIHIFGQIIATWHDLTPNGGLVAEIPLFQGNLGWWDIIIWPNVLYIFYLHPP